MNVTKMCDSCYLFDEPIFIKEKLGDEIFYCEGFYIKSNGEKCYLFRQIDEMKYRHHYKDNKDPGLKAKYFIEIHS